MAQGAYKSDVLFANEVLARMTNCPFVLLFPKIGQSCSEWRFVAFHDVGWAVRPSLHSQAEALLFVATDVAIRGASASSTVIDWICARIGIVCTSSVDAELTSLQQCGDVIRLYQQSLWMVLNGWSSKQVSKWKPTGKTLIVSDNKGLYTALVQIEIENPLQRQGENRLQINKVILAEDLRQMNVDYRWATCNHRLADALAQLSISGARIGFLQQAVGSNFIRVTDCQQSGRREAGQLIQEIRTKSKFQAEDGFMMINDADDDSDLATPIILGQCEEMYEADWTSLEMLGSWLQRVSHYHSTITGRHLSLSRCSSPSFSHCVSPVLVSSGDLFCFVSGFHLV